MIEAKLAVVVVCATRTGWLEEDLIMAKVSDRPTHGGSLPSSARPSDRTWNPGELAFIDLAICKGHDRLFFPHYNEQPSARAQREAKATAMCQQCPVALTCRDFARRHGEYGIWGGETEEQRVMAGVQLPYPFSPRAVRRLRAAATTTDLSGAVAMPLTELVGPTEQELADAERWLDEV
jgi:WhiB family redox-sensing transcriptional regulator